MGIRSCKNSRNFLTFCNCAFLQLKREPKMCWLQIRCRCSRCPDFHQKSRNFMRNGWGKPPMEIPHTLFEGEDVFMKGKMYLWRGRCTYEGEDVFMKAKMYLWKGRCIYEAKMCLWRGRCIYEGEYVFIKGKMYSWRGRCIYEGRKKSWNFWRN